MPQGTLRVPALERDAERPGLHSHAERGNDQLASRILRIKPVQHPILRTRPLESIFPYLTSILSTYMSFLLVIVNDFIRLLPGALKLT